MRTRAIYFPNEKEADMEVEIDRNGDVVSCVGYLPILDDWIDCRERVSTSKIWRERIAEKFAEIDWQDHEPRDPEEWVTSPLDIIKEALRPA